MGTETRGLLDVSFLFGTKSIADMPHTVTAPSNLEEVRAPLAVINRLFQASKAEGRPWDPTAHFRQVLETSWDEIPLLNDVDNVEQLTAGTLVRFRCMVQNIYNPEWYVAEYDLVNKESGDRIRACGHFSDVIQNVPGYTSDMEGPSAVTQDRLPLHCMNIPGESEWVRRALHGPTLSQPEGGRSKRALEDDDMGDDNAMMGEMECDGADQNKKIARAPASGCTGHHHEGVVASTCSGAVAAKQPAKVEGARVQHAAIVKVYEAGAEDNLKVHDLVEFAGILSADAVLAEFSSNVSDEMTDSIADAFAATGPPPSSVVPRLHAVCYKKLPSAMWAPAIDTLPIISREPTLSSVTAQADHIRAAVVRRLVRALGGDMLAAEYLLLNVLSSITARNGGVLVGKLALGLIGFDNSIAKPGSLLATTISEILPMVSYLPLTTSSLNKAPLAPKKDYNTELLHTGPLQLASGTQLVVDETTMAPGQLNDTGCKNLMSLQALIQQQNIPFDFAYYNVDFPTDVPIVVTSQVKPLCPVDCLLKLAPDAASLAAVSAHVPHDDEVHQCRIFLGGARARAREVEITDEVCSLAEAKFVQARQADANVNQETLHLWLTLARLLAASYMETKISQQRWEQMLAMEAQRVARA